MFYSIREAESSGANTTVIRYFTLAASTSAWRGKAKEWQRTKVRRDNPPPRNGRVHTESRRNRLRRQSWDTTNRVRLQPGRSLPVQSSSKAWSLSRLKSIRSRWSSGIVNKASGNKSAPKSKNSSLPPTRLTAMVGTLCAGVRRLSGRSCGWWARWRHLDYRLTSATLGA